jgi:hypothetical protein
MSSAEEGQRHIYAQELQHKNNWTVNSAALFPIFISLDENLFKIQKK